MNELDKNEPSDPGAAVLSDPRVVPAGHGWAWLVQGFHYFKLNPGPWVVSVILIFVVNVVVALIPFLGTLIVSVASPVFVAGYMIGCQARVEGRDFEITHPFAAFSRNVGQLMLVGVIYMVASLVIMLLVAAIFGGGFFLLADMEAMQSGDPAAMADAGSIGGMIFGSLLAMLCFIPVIMLYWFAPALVVLHDVPAVKAMQMSFQACLKNIVPFLVYGLITMVLWILAAIPFLLGMLIVGPMVVASIHAAYRDIFLGSASSFESSTGTAA